MEDGRPSEGEARESWTIFNTIRYSEQPVTAFHSLSKNEQDQVISYMLEDCVVVRKNVIPRADMVALTRRGLNYIPCKEEEVRALIEDRKRMRDESKEADSTWNNTFKVLGSCSHPVERDSQGRIDLKREPYSIRNYFGPRWRVLHSPQIRPARDIRVEWDGMSPLCFGDENSPGLQIRPYFESLQNRLRLDWEISSQLLLYRIMCTFGYVGTVEVDHYKQCWQVNLVSVLDPTCTLQLYDHKGGPSAYFCGTEVMSTEALQLLEWLIGDNVPHTYDYTLCGTIA